MISQIYQFILYFKQFYYFFKYLRNSLNYIILAIYVM